MLHPAPALALVAAGAMLAATPALAGRRVHHHHAVHHRQLVRGYGGAYGYGPAPQAYGGYYGTNGWEAQANAAATARAYREPGTTLELAPDAKLTATGGPVGGVPGFEGQ